MSLQYLLDPQLQYSDKSGALNVAGFLRVYLNGTDDRAITYKDFNGTLNTADIVLDNNGRAVVIADSSKAYRLEVYTSDGDLQWTQYPLNTIVGGAGGTNGFVVESTDGSIAVDRYDSAGVIHYDLSSNVEDGTDLLEWIRCDGATKNSDTYTPIYTDGTMEVGTKGIKVYADRYYHVTAHLRASKSTVQPYYDKVDVLFRLVDDNDVETNVIRQSVIVDSSVGLVQDYEVSTDVKVDEDAELILDILNTTVPGITWDVLNLEAHRVFSGAPVIPGGVQRTLIAGANITIEHTGAGDVISSTGGGGGTTEYTAGTGIVVDNTEHTISVANNVVIDGSYVHTDTNFTTADASKLSGIEAGAQANVQSDWDVDDASSDAYIRNRPDLSQYATQSDLDDYQPLLTAGTGIDLTSNTVSVDNTVAMKSDLPDLTDYVTDSELQTALSDYATDTELSNGLATKQDVLTAGSNITISGSTISATDTTYSAGTGLSLSGTEFSVDSTVVALKSDLPDLTTYVTDTDLQTILQGYQEALTAGTNISISNGVISATDTTYSAGSGLSLNGTTFSVDTSTIATKNDLSGKQDTLTAGDGIAITSNVVSAKVDGSTITTNANGELVATGSGNAQSVIRVDNISSMTTTQTLVHTDDFDIIYDPTSSNKPIYLSSSTVDTACVYMREICVSYNSDHATTTAWYKIYGVPQYKQAFSGVSLANPVEVWSFSIGSASTMPSIPVREFTIFYTKDNVPHMTKMTLFCTWIIDDNTNKPVPDFMYASIYQL